MAVQLDPSKVVDFNTIDICNMRIQTRYCVDNSVHEEQVRASLARNLPPIPVVLETTYDPIAVVCSGPSLKRTWEEVKKFSKVISCSGAHDFLIERGIVPSYHMETDRDKLRFESLVKANIIKMFPLSQPPGGRGKFVLYQPPSAHMRAYWKLPADFDEVQLSSLRNEYPDLPVKIYGKGSGILGEALVDCELFVSFNSAAGFFALEMGVMTESTSPVSWWPHKGLDRADFEEAGRTAFAYAAGRTFNFEEKASGEAFYHMLSNGEFP